MAIELEKIQFKDFQEPAVGAENLNKLQDNTQNALNTLDTNKQDTLTAGDNITIENGVISAIDTTYTAGDNITIENGIISAIGGGSSEIEYDLTTTDGYIRYSNGIQIAWKKVTASLGGSAWGNSWYSDHTMGNWKVPFATLLFADTFCAISQYWTGQESVSNTSAGKVRAFRPNSEKMTGTVGIYAIGTWE